jgi:hypothetical protein
VACERSFPDYSGGTVPDFHRLPCYALAGTQDLYNESITKGYLLLPAASALHGSMRRRCRRTFQAGALLDEVHSNFPGWPVHQYEAARC